MTETWFAVTAGIAVVVMLAIGAVAVVAEDPDPTLWSPPEPSVYVSDDPPEPGTATVGDRSFDRLQDAVDAASPGDIVEMEGRFEERVTIDTSGIELRTATGADSPALIDADGEGSPLTIEGDNVVIRDVRIANSGFDRNAPDAGIMVRGAETSVESVQITDSLFGVWIDGAPDVVIANSTIVGPAHVAVSERGNGIHLWQADGATIVGNDITQVRDGIYFQWSSDVTAADNRLWDLRYGVHYMYSDDNRLIGNLAFDNDVGFALMVSENLTVEDNIAIDNRGPSSHGILAKDIDDSVFRGNEVINNGQGFVVYNAHNNVFVENLIMKNDVGIRFTAGSSGETVVGNSFINNDLAAISTAVTTQSAWNDSVRGNYWSEARALDLDGDGTSEIRHQPMGIVEQLVQQRPASAVFAESPAFDAVRLAESSFPIFEIPGIVDHRPLTEPEHDHWRSYYVD